MVDYDDVEDAAWFGPAGIIGLVLVLALLFFAYNNDKECQAKSCPNGSQPKLMEHSCLCAEEAK